MNNSKVKVLAICDSKNCTWDIISEDRKTCIFYGTEEEVEQWCVDHENTHHVEWQ